MSGGGFLIDDGRVVVGVGVVGGGWWRGEGVWGRVRLVGWRRVSWIRIGVDWRWRVWIRGLF